MHGDMQTVQTVTLVLLCAVAALLDLRTGRIPNALTLPGIAAGLLLAGFAGWRVLALRAAAVTLVLAAGMILFAGGAVGGGDGKFAAAIAALRGFQFFAESLLCAVLIGGIVAAIVLARKKQLFDVLRGVLTRLAGGKSEVPEYPASQLRLAPIIAAGVLVTITAARCGTGLFETLF